jgi:hypothetical protein
MTTQSLINRLIRQYKKYGQTYLHTSSNHLYCFPKELLNDLVIKISSNLYVSAPIYFNKNGEIPSDISPKDIQNLCIHLQKLEVVCDEEFNLVRGQISAIQNLIVDKETLYTHIRFFSENNQVKVRIFDYTSFVNELYVNDKPIEIYEELIEKTFIKNDFNFSINVLPFKELPIDDYIVETFGNDYIKFTNMNGISYYIRNQNIQEPIVNVINDQPEQDIVFCFQPSLISASGHTNL